MTSSSTPDPAAPDPAGEPSAGDRWLALQRGVAAGMVATFAFVMLAVAGAFVPPLAVAGALFATLLGLSFARPRGSALAIGSLASLWLASQFVNAARVLPDLAEPAAVGTFLTTVAMIVVPAVGAVGVLGLLRGLSARTATRAWQAAGATVVLAVLTGAAASIIADETPMPVEGRDGVAVLDHEFQPAHVEVPTGTAVTWDWADAGAGHDVVGEGFASEVRTQGTFSHVFEEPGIHDYECTLHPGMRGTVTVVETDVGDTAG